MVAKRITAGSRRQSPSTPSPGSTDFDEFHGDPGKTLGANTILARRTLVLHVWHSTRP